MSLKAMIWVMEDAPVENHAELAILYALADRANDDGTAAWPTQAWLAERARCSGRTVRRHLAALEERGVIRRGDQRLVMWERSDRRPIVWDLNMSLARQRSDKSPSAAGQNGPPPAAGQNGRADKSGTNGRTNQVERPDTAVSYKPSTTIHRTVLTPSSPPATPAVAANNVDVAHATSSETIKDGYPPEFETWWMIYPRKTGKRAAYKAWQQALKRVSADVLSVKTDAFAQLVRSERRETRFIPHGATWLNRDGWLDDLDAERHAGTGNAFLDMLSTPQTADLSGLKQLPMHG